MTELVITTGAEQDYTESLQFYSERSKRAARAFEIEFARALDAIAANPDRYPRCDDRHRFVLLKGYPFQVIYRALSDEQCLIVAIAHTSRQPGYWSTR